MHCFNKRASIFNERLALPNSLDLSTLKINSGYDLFYFLKQHIYVGDENSWWWPSKSSIRVIGFVEINGAKNPLKPVFSHLISSILGQNTKYENAAKALDNLYKNNIFKEDEDKSIESFLNLAQENLAFIIKSSGFYNQKARNILLLLANLKSDFSSFANFYENVTREWLLSQKGIGPESCDGILNYCLKKEELVGDKYTQKLLATLGYEFFSYEDMVVFLKQDLYRAKSLYSFDISLAQIYARFHGKIVEFSKKYKLPKI